MGANAICTANTTRGVCRAQLTCLKEIFVIQQMTSGESHPDKRLVKWYDRPDCIRLHHMSTASSQWR
jgi:hypothetical protein